MKASFTYDDIPEFAVDETQSEPAANGSRRRSREIRARARLAPIGRRGVMMGMLAVGSGFALNVLGSLPPARIRSASAGHRTYSHRCPTGGHCCPGRYNTRTCGPSGTSTDFCARNGWHRHDSVPINRTTDKVFWVEARCAGFNAWHWESGSGSSWRRYRCSDGNFKHVRGGRVVLGPVRSICPRLVGVP